MRICPKTKEACPHNYPAGCGHFEAHECNKPLTIPEFEAISEENKELMAQLRADLASGKVCLS